MLNKLHMLFNRLCLFFRSTVARDLDRRSSAGVWVDKGSSAELKLKRLGYKSILRVVRHNGTTQFLMRRD